MAASVEKTALEQLARDLENASTWVGGDRAQYLLNLAEQARGVAAGKVDTDAVKAREENERELAKATEEAVRAAQEPENG